MGARDVIGLGGERKGEKCNQTEDGGVYCEWNNGDKSGEAKAVDGTVVNEEFENYDRDEIDELEKRIINKSTNENVSGRDRGVHAKRN